MENTECRKLAQLFWHLTEKYEDLEEKSLEKADYPT